ncbi:LPP20 family lipoprotein [Pokkaliibacter sp. CJK22405]|uniref:LPP20 family lipoprotein n=1 Tax=Pokkaliibacter sp. CJK22405 TaxID=3384615 RepID=UPI00398564A5
MDKLPRYLGQSKTVVAMAALAAVVLLAGCQNTQPQAAQQATAPERGQMVRDPQVITVVGYAPISLQPGQTQSHKELMAMKASKLQAYQELAAVVQGQVISTRSSMNDMVLQGEKIQSAISGIIRGARVVKTYPVQDDVYATVLELDLRNLPKELRPL